MKLLNKMNRIRADCFGCSSARARETKIARAHAEKSRRDFSIQQDFRLYRFYDLLSRRRSQVHLDYPHARVSLDLSCSRAALLPQSPMKSPRSTTVSTGVARCRSEYLHYTPIRHRPYLLYRDYPRTITDNNRILT